MLGGRRDWGEGEKGEEQAEEVGKPIALYANWKMSKQ